MKDYAQAIAFGVSWMRHTSYKIEYIDEHRRAIDYI